MAELNSMLMQQLTPEQEEMLRRQAISESWGPLDFLTPMGIGGAIGGVAGRFAGRGLVRAGDALADIAMPTLGTVSRMVGYTADPAVRWAGRGGAALGALGGVAAGDDLAQKRLMDLNMPPRPKYDPRNPFDE